MTDFNEGVHATWINAKCSICGEPTIIDGVVVSDDVVVIKIYKEVNHVACIDKEREWMGLPAYRHRKTYRLSRRDDSKETIGLFTSRKLIEEFLKGYCLTNGSLASEYNIELQITEVDPIFNKEVVGER